MLLTSQTRYVQQRYFSTPASVVGVQTWRPIRVALFLFPFCHARVGEELRACALLFNTQ
jgi:hypothetical protein